MTQNSRNKIISLFLYAVYFLKKIHLLFFLSLPINHLSYHVAYAELRLDKIFKTRFFQLFAEPSHIDCQSVFIYKTVRLPQAFHQLLSAHYLAFVFHKGKKYPILIFSQLYLLVAKHEHIAAGI